jgi:osmoprotectant transport system permease protein
LNAVLNSRVVKKSIIKNRILLTLILLFLLTALQFAFLNHAPNRLVSGESMHFFSLLQGPFSLLLLPIILLIAFIFFPQQRLICGLTIFMAAGLLSGLVLLAAVTARQLDTGGESLVRTSLGGAFWLMAGLSVLIAFNGISRITRSQTWRMLLNLQVLLPVILLLFFGQLQHLSLLKEYVNHQDMFYHALWDHLYLSFFALLGAMALGLPLSFLCIHMPVVRTLLFFSLSMIQAIPAIALLGLLIAPLAALASRFPWLAQFSISGTGTAPAMIALVLYALFPLMRNTVTGLENVPRHVIETARAMGMTLSQLFFRVQLPVSLPFILAGIRITAVQIMGLTVLAALIGAGGLGGIIFQGLSSHAVDLVLLGVLPLVSLIIIVDSFFKYICAVTGITGQ